MPTHPKLTQVPMVIYDVLDVVGRLHESYAESFVLIYILFAEIEAKQKNRPTYSDHAHPPITYPSTQGHP